ncbi:hypothetical protein DFA_05577 [Cavenderia fasciculata]|uniref:Uncharacterized protein n=1 Tax=Cavenderia fasciculata TaxID=261658 RepID=F4PLM2_CACFS|nr:uncharacterized protein DFA_05577 [Cavenderia fasciculata]EGG23444.1 hypothetical protein DFA_05577 [Cavenderia fasciculata]|eukprot:XP_004361295.1 hypothetical protein DFA_05577 [Cavenderia fasciculata]
MLIKVDRDTTIPRINPYLTGMLLNTNQSYRVHVDEQLNIVWDKDAMTTYLMTNSICKYTRTRYPQTEQTVSRLGLLSKLTMAIHIVQNNRAKFPKKQWIKIMKQAESLEMAIDKLGKMALPYWKVHQQWAEEMRRAVLMITLLAFQMGVNKYIHPPLVDLIKMQIMDQMEFIEFDNVEDFDTKYNHVWKRIQPLCVGECAGLQQFAFYTKFQD